MPEMQGTALVREVTRISPHIATVLMSGTTVDPAELTKHIPLLKKPFSTQELICAINAALEQSAQLKRNLKLACERAIELRHKNLRLRSELQETLAQNEDTRWKLRAEILRTKTDTAPEGSGGSNPPAR
jgi:response regulator RpfG family c-di-GMP phosphodiesterase